MSSIFFLLSLAIEAAADAVAETPMSAGDHMMALACLASLRGACEAGQIDLADFSARVELLDGDATVANALNRLAKAVDITSRGNVNAGAVWARNAVTMVRHHRGTVLGAGAPADSCTVVPSELYADCIEFRPAAHA